MLLCRSLLIHTKVCLLDISKRHYVYNTHTVEFQMCIGIYIDCTHIVIVIIRHVIRVKLYKPIYFLCQ